MFTSVQKKFLSIIMTAEQIEIIKTVVQQITTSVHNKQIIVFDTNIYFKAYSRWKSVDMTKCVQLNFF